MVLGKLLWLSTIRMGGTDMAVTFESSIEYSGAAVYLEYLDSADAVQTFKVGQKTDLWDGGTAYQDMLELLESIQAAESISVGSYGVVPRHRWLRVYLETAQATYNKV
mgnify:CR=1 FL=1